MIYYTIYLKRLNNGTGYVDIALHDDQLLKDFEQYLDIGVRAHRLYKLADTPGAATAGTDPAADPPSTVPPDNSNI